MTADDQAKQLHDRATRGETLSEEEKSLLESWYSHQDRAESELLGLMDAEDTSTALKSQIETMLTQLTTLTQRIQEVASENEILREEIAILRRRLTGLSAAKKAA